MYWTEFLTVALIHLLAVASPGPDFAVVVRESVTHGRRAGTWTAMGVGTAIFLHVGYSLLGIGLIVSQSIVLFNALKWLAAAYLLYIGIKALRAKPASAGRCDLHGCRRTYGTRCLYLRFRYQWTEPQGDVVFPVVVHRCHQPAHAVDGPGRLWRVPGRRDGRLVLSGGAAVQPGARTCRVCTDGPLVRSGDGRGAGCAGREAGLYRD